jgi:hypothetical protein
VGAVNALTVGVLARLAQALTSDGIQEVTCPHCEVKHTVTIPRYDVRPNDLLVLLRARAMMKGDPEFDPGDSSRDDTEARRVGGLSQEDLESEVREVLRDAETYDIG